MKPRAVRVPGWISLLAVAALLAAALALWQLYAGEAGVQRQDAVVDGTPVTVYSPAEGASGPPVLIAHGFAGSQRLMEPFALTLARNGYTAVTYDFLGHGRNPRPLYGDVTAPVTEPGSAGEALVAQTRAVAEYARRITGRQELAILGHSMATTIVARYAQLDPAVEATVGVSLFAPTVDAETPRNLLVIVGGLEGRLIEEGRRVVAMAAGIEPGAVQPGRTYGDPVDGNARRLAVIEGVEHISVLYSGESLGAALDWLDRAFERSSAGEVAVRGPWILLLLAAVIALARPASRLLPRVAAAWHGADASWRTLALASGVPALLTPLLLAPIPTGFLPVLVADYVAVHFALYGVLSAAALWWLGGRPSLRRLGGRVLPEGRPWRLALAAAALTGYCVIALGWPIDRFVTSFYPVLERLPLMLAMLAGTLPYFLADEWLTRGGAARRGAYPATKLLFLLSLGLAIALDFEGLFFLIIIVPVIMAFFVVYGLFSRWAYRRSRHPFVAGVANAVAFAWALAVTFPLLGGGQP